MRSRATIGIVAAFSMGLAACGGSSTSSASTTSTQNATPPVAQTAQQTGAGYYNMATLQADIRTLIDRRLGNPAGQYYMPDVSVTDVTCIQDGAQGATCVVTYSNGITGSAAVTIARDGQSYVTH